jgi:cytochrome P450
MREENEHMKIDLFDPNSFAHGHPLAQYDWLRANDPVHFQAEPNGPGYWAVTRFQDVWDVDRNFQAFSSEPTIMIQDPLAEVGGGFGPYKMMLMMDPPQHTAFRRLIRQEFTVPTAADKKSRMQQLAQQIVDAVIEKGECDFVSQVAGEMPSYVIAELMGMPLDDGRELYHLTEAIHAAPGTVPGLSGGEAVMKMFEYGRKLIEEKRARPKDDLATKLLQAEVDGKRLDDIEFLLFFLLLIDAGGDTTRNLLSGGMIALLENPDQHRWLMADLPGRLASAREEMLRWTTPVIYMRRTAKHDVDLAEGEGGRQGRDVFRLGQPRPGKVRPRRPARSVAHAQRAHRLRHRPARVPGPAHRAHRDRCDADGGADADAGLPPEGAAALAAVQLHQRPADDAGDVHAGETGGVAPYCCHPGARSASRDPSRRCPMGPGSARC